MEDFLLLDKQLSTEERKIRDAVKKFVRAANTSKNFCFRS